MLQWTMGISLAGLAGVWARVGLVFWLTPLVGGLTWLPVGIVNVVGCLLMGCLFGVFATLKAPHPWEPLRMAIAMGFLGGLTTFSSFAWDAFTLWQQWRNTQIAELFYQLVITLVLQPVLGLIAVAIGFTACKWVLLR
ncbi:MAG: CrcB family protein [Candidatus Melainabacteria bacterium]|jgi:CrcB protein|nr:CrcB family protein [Candidatus Melainabacteria bacterium]